MTPPATCLPGAAGAAGIGDPNSPHYPRPFNPTPPYAHGFPIEGAPPDLRPWAAGNTGIPYLWTFHAPVAGPHLAFVALTHGEEWSGAHALHALLRDRVRPERGQLSLLFANHRAHARWNTAEPNRAFYIDRDLNRVWDPALLDGPEPGIELDRARELRPFLATVDMLIDLHSTQQPSPPMALAGPLARTANVACAIGWPAILIRDRPHAAGPRLRDWAGFEDPHGHRTAIVVECGQHWRADTTANAHRAVLAVLRHLGMAPPSLLAHAPPPRPATVIQTTLSIKAETDDCQLLKVWPDLAIVRRAGTLLGHDGATEIRSPHDDAVLILPARRPRKGLTAVRFGQTPDIAALIEAGVHVDPDR